jgi:hypothetical protein
MTTLLLAFALLTVQLLRAASGTASSSRPSFMNYHGDKHDFNPRAESNWHVIACRHS